MRRLRRYWRPRCTKAAATSPTAKLRYERARRSERLAADFIQAAKHIKLEASPQEYGDLIGASLASSSNRNPSMVRNFSPGRLPHFEVQSGRSRQKYSGALENRTPYSIKIKLLQIRSDTLS